MCCNIGTRLGLGDSDFGDFFLVILLFKVYQICPIFHPFFKSWIVSITEDDTNDDMTSNTEIDNIAFHDILVDTENYNKQNVSGEDFILTIIQDK